MNTIILEGGLGNRMRVAAAAYAMAKQLAAHGTPIPFRVLWTKQWGMQCRFDELFKAPADPPPERVQREHLIVPSSPHPVREGAVTNDSCKADACSEHTAPSLIGRAGGGSAEASFSLRDTSSFLFSRPTLKNLHAPRLLQHLCYRHIIYAPQIWYLNKDGFDYEAWFRQGGTLMTAYRDFCPWTSDDLRTLFQPNEEVQRLIDERTADFSPNTIGIHIRRTDHQQAIDESPIELFFEAIDRELNAPPLKPVQSEHLIVPSSSHPVMEEANPFDSSKADACSEHSTPSLTGRAGGGSSIYLATDDEATKDAMRKRYGKRVIMSNAKATRESTDGIRDALVEMYALSRTCHIFGSAGSTFSPIAAALGDVPITILQRNGAGKIDLLCQLNQSEDSVK